MSTVNQTNLCEASNSANFQVLSWILLLKRIVSVGFNHCKTLLFNRWQPLDLPPRDAVCSKATFAVPLIKYFGASATRATAGLCTDHHMCDSTTVFPSLKRQAAALCFSNMWRGAGVPKLLAGGLLVYAFSALAPQDMESVMCLLLCQLQCDDDDVAGN